ncbi:hypothetical protein BST61_g7667 [Cercospora zeina]
MDREWWMSDRLYWRNLTSPHLERQGNWQEFPDDGYSTLADLGPLHSYGSWTQYGLFPCVEATPYSAADQAYMLQQAEAGGMPMDFSDSGGPLGVYRGGAGDIGEPYWLGWQFYRG